MRKRSISVLALTIAVIITAYFIVTMWATTAVDKNFRGLVSTDIFPTYDDTAFGGLFVQPEINDSLPHYLYQHIADSIKQVNDERQLENRSVAVSGFGFSSLGVYSMKSAQKRDIEQGQSKDNMRRITDLLDSLTIAADKKIATLKDKDSIQQIRARLRDTLAYFNRGQTKRTDITDDLYYIGLQGYSLAYETKFYVQNGTYNLAVLKLDSLKRSDNDTWRYGHYERKQIPVRYSGENKMVFIPLSQQQFKVLNVIIPILSACLLAFAIYFFLGLPIQILINISKGKAFNDKNVQRFNSMALALLIMTLGTILSPYILRLCFWKMIPDDFIFPGFWSKVWDKIELFIAVIVIFITGKAFQKGNNLQKEQDLTI